MRGLGLAFLLGLGLILGMRLLGCTSEAPAQGIGRDEAEKLALRQIPGGFITSGKQEVDLGRLMYKILVQNGSEARRVTIDAATGKVMETRDRTEELQREKAAGENVPEPVSLSQRDAAEFAALHAYPGLVHKWKVKREEGRIIYRFHIVAENQEEARVTVDWRTQKVVAIEKENRQQQ